MGKLNYDRINWKGRTNFEFCGCEENLIEMWRRYRGRFNNDIELEKFAYAPVNEPHVLEKGDLVAYKPAGHDLFDLLGVVTEATASTISYKFANGGYCSNVSRDIIDRTRPSSIPHEIMELALAAAGKCSVDFSKCPLKDEGACMK